MIGRRPQPPRRRLVSRFAVPPGALRHGHRPGEPRPLRLALVRPLRLRAARPAAAARGVHPFVRHRISLLLVPRIEVGVDRRTSVSAGPPATLREPRPTAILTTRVERLVRQVERHSTRIERSEQLAATSARRTASDPLATGGPTAPVLEAAPRLVPVRRSESPSAPPPPTTRAATPAREPAFGWPPPDPAALADGVLRELDRRIVAERERRGGLA